LKQEYQNDIEKEHYYPGLEAILKVKH